LLIILSYGFYGFIFQIVSILLFKSFFFRNIKFTYSKLTNSVIKGLIVLVFSLILLFEALVLTNHIKLLFQLNQLNIVLDFIFGLINIILSYLLYLFFSNEFIRKNIYIIWSFQTILLILSLLIFLIFPIQIIY
jgi:hypothetical protein